MFNKLLKILFFVTLELIITFGMAGCYDLGEDVKTEDDYYSLFPTVTLVSQDDIDVIDMEDIYNKDTANNLTSPLSTDKKYRFMIISVNPSSGMAVTCDSVAMCLLYSGDEVASLEANCYLGNQSLVDKIFSSERVFSESSETLLGHATVNLKVKSNIPKARTPQNSFVINFGRQTFTSNSFIIITFKSTSSDVAFRPTNIMVHTNSLRNEG